MMKMTQMNTYTVVCGLASSRGDAARGLAEEQGPQMKKMTQMNAYRGDIGARRLAGGGGALAGSLKSGSTDEEDCTDECL